MTATQTLIAPQQQSLRAVTVVFKTHLDVGFTDLAREVRRAYHEEYIPAAIRLARELEHAGDAARFVWTTGSWLIDEHLREASPHSRADLERAIEDGHVAWHALPFTAHSELMDPALFRGGLAISRRLDVRFGRTTTAAKLTDVPGHTIGIVPLLAEAGVRYLQVGVNPSSAVPDVPGLFVWRAPDGTEIIVGYSSDYGDYEAAREIGDTREALYFAQTGDNHGPPTAADVRALFARLARRYPDAAIRAGRMDEAVKALEASRADLPVVTSEIADTWIHGVGSDPQLVRGFRRLQALRTRWLASGELQEGCAEDVALVRRLLLIPEHTWGRDVKEFLPDYVNWTKPAFRAARERDVIDLAINPPETTPFLTWADARGRLGYSRLEASWDEQRSYLPSTIAALHPARQAVAEAALASEDAWQAGDVDAQGEGKDVPVGTWIEAGAFTLRVDQQGALSGLRHRPSGRVLADDDHRLAVFSYEQFTADDYDDWLARYQRDLDRTGDWAIPDFGKPGLRDADPARTHRIDHPQCVSVRRHDGRSATRVVARLRYSEDFAAVTGAPREVTLRYDIPSGGDRIDIGVSWRGKDADRRPEATWLSFRPVVADPAGWRLRKLGIAVDPLDVVSRGNRSLHAVTAAEHLGPDGALVLHTADTPLVAPGTPKLVRFDDAVPDLDGGVHVNLHNNVWGTNFRMWLDDDFDAVLTLALRDADTREASR